MYDKLKEEETGGGAMEGGCNRGQNYKEKTECKYCSRFSIAHLFWCIQNKIKRSYIYEYLLSCMRVDMRAIALLRISCGIWIFLEVTYFMFFDTIFWFTSEGPHIFHPDDSPHRALLHRILFYRGNKLYAEAIMSLTAVVSLLYAVGYKTHMTALCTYTLTAIYQSKLASCRDGGDRMLRAFVFWSFFLPIDEMWSVDSLIRKYYRKNAVDTYSHPHEQQNQKKEEEDVEEKGQEENSLTNNTCRIRKKGEVEMISYSNNSNEKTNNNNILNDHKDGILSVNNNFSKKSAYLRGADNRAFLGYSLKHEYSSAVSHGSIGVIWQLSLVYITTVVCRWGPSGRDWFLNVNTGLYYILASTFISSNNGQFVASYFSPFVLQIAAAASNIVEVVGAAIPPLIPHTHPLRGYVTSLLILLQINILMTTTLFRFQIVSIFANLIMMPSPFYDFLQNLRIFKIIENICLIFFLTIFVFVKQVMRRLYIQLKRTNLFGKINNNNDNSDIQAEKRKQMEYKEDKEKEEGDSAIVNEGSSNNKRTFFDLNKYKKFVYNCLGWFFAFYLFYKNAADVDLIPLVDKGYVAHGILQEQYWRMYAPSPSHAGGYWVLLGLPYDDTNSFMKKNHNVYINNDTYYSSNYYNKTIPMDYELSYGVHPAYDGPKTEEEIKIIIKEKGQHNTYDDGLVYRTLRDMFSYTNKTEEKENNSNNNNKNSNTISNKENDNYVFDLMDAYKSKRYVLHKMDSLYMKSLHVLGPRCPACTYFNKFWETYFHRMGRTDSNKQFVVKKLRVIAQFFCEYFLLYDKIRLKEVYIRHMHVRVRPFGSVKYADMSDPQFRLWTNAPFFVHSVDYNIRHKCILTK